MAKSKAANPLAERLNYLRKECGLTECAAADRSGGRGLPVGKGQSCVMEEATLKFNKNNDPMITWHLVGTDPDLNENRHEFVNINLREDGKSFPYAKADVVAMGLDWDDEIDACLKTLAKHPDATAVHIEGATGLDVLVDVWEKDEYTNVAIVGTVEGAGAKRPKAKDEPEAEPGLTEADIKAMSDDELDDLAVENDIDPETIETYDELREVLIDKLV